MPSLIFRGAVGFSLAVVIDHNVWYRELFVSAALVMVFFTVFLQGGTIKLLVKLFNIDLESKEKDKTICYEIQGELMEDVMDGVEKIVGVQKAVNWISSGFDKLDQLLKKIIVHEDSQVHRSNESCPGMKCLFLRLTSRGSLRR